MYLAGLAAPSGLLIWQAGDLSLGITVVGGFGVAVALFAVLAWLGLRFISGSFFARKIAFSNIALRYGLANLRRHARGNAIQVASLALGLTAVLLLTFTRNDLVDAWRRSAPPDANRPARRAARPAATVKEFFAEKNHAPEQSMVRARLTAVNGRKVSERLP